MYKALKPCNFGDGQQYYIGDLIPKAVIAPNAVQRLINMGYITEVKAVTSGEETADKSPVIESATRSILVKTDDGGEVILEPTDHGIQDIFSVLVGTASDAEPIIKQMDDKDALILIYLADSRKTVKAAAEARGKELMEEAGEQ